MFCQKCGEKLPEGAMFCGACGASQVKTPSEKIRQNVMHTKVEYLTISPEFQSDKKKLEALYGKRIALGYVLLAGGALLMMISIFNMFNDPLTWFMILMLGMAVMVGGGIFAQISDAQKKKKLEELSDIHYRKYIDEFNVRED